MGSSGGGDYGAYAQLAGSLLNTYNQAQNRASQNHPGGQGGGMQVGPGGGGGGMQAPGVTPPPQAMSAQQATGSNPFALGGLGVLQGQMPGQPQQPQPPMQGPYGM